MAGIGAVDEDFRPAMRFDSWLDMRCQPYIDALVKDHADEVTALTGCPPTCAHAAKMLWWQHERPEEYRRIAKFVAPAGYVAGRLAGLKAERRLHGPHVSALHRRWRMRRRGAGRTRWRRARHRPRADAQDRRAHGRSSARRRRTAARDFGLPAGVPVVAGAGDTAASALGAGIVRPGMLLDVAGTASVLAGCTDRFVADVKNRTLLVMRSVVPGLWHPLAYIGGGGLALRWFRDQFGGPESERLGPGRHVL